MTEEYAVAGSSIAGRIITPDSDEYDEARRIWNGAVDRQPALIVYPQNTDDVAHALAYARSNSLTVSVRGGGHGVGGRAVGGEVVIDLANLRQVKVEPAFGRVTVGGGASWADVDAATQAHDLAIPGGVMSRTGVGGLTLGGGLGWLRRAFGLSSDLVTGFEVVTAAGEILRVDEGNHPELFWALRGSGRNLAVVTEFEFSAGALNREVMFAQVFYAGADGMQVLRSYRDFAASTPDEVTTSVIITTVPPAAPFPPASHGTVAVMIAGLYAGPIEDGETALAPLRTAAGITPLADLSGPREYVEVQQAFDALYPDGRQYYWTSSFLEELPDAVLQSALEAASARPSALSAVAFWQLGGAIDHIDEAATAYGHRGAKFLLGVEANWEETDPDAGTHNVEWARECLEAVAPFSTGGRYINLVSAEDDALFAQLDTKRLKAIAEEYDPAALFAT